VWQSVPKKGIDFRERSARDRYWLYGTVSFCMLALLELFGLLEVERGEPADGENWRILGVRPTAFGEALIDKVFSWQLDQLLHPEEDAPDFGVWQPLLQEDFPDWRKNLEFPEPEYRDGVYYFKVRLGKPWRRIAIPADHDLETLAGWIITAFEFDGDHLYGFSFRERDGSEVSVEHPYVDEAWAHTDEYSIGYLPLEEGQSMKFLYDYGASWRFDVKLEKVETPDRRMTEPRIVESHGKAPEEYDF
jgi:hypothetical protein